MKLTDNLNIKIPTFEIIWILCAVSLLLFMILYPTTDENRVKYLNEYNYRQAVYIAKLSFENKQLKTFILKNCKERDLERKLFIDFLMKMKLQMEFLDKENQEMKENIEKEREKHMVENYKHCLFQKV